MRKLLIGAALGAVMLAVAAIAMAETTVTFSQTFVNAKGKTSKKPGASAGTSFATTATESDNEANNHQPKPAREFDVTFPAGSKIDTKGHAACKTLDESQPDPCPKNTKIGDGHAQVILPFNGQPPVNADVTAYNRPGGLWLYVVPELGNPVVLKPVFKGLKLKTKVPPTCIASTNQNGHCVTNTGQPGQEAVLSEFDLKTKPSKKGKHVFLRAPKTCPKGGWTFKADITYDDGSKKSLSAKSPCTKP